MLQHWFSWSQGLLDGHEGLEGGLGAVGTQHSKPLCHCQVLGQDLVELEKKTKMAFVEMNARKVASVAKGLTEAKGDSANHRLTSSSHQFC